MLKSLMSEYKRQTRNEGVQRELEYSSEGYDEEIKVKPMPPPYGQTHSSPDWVSNHSKAKWENRWVRRSAGEDLQIGKPLYNTQNGENTKKRKNKITSDLTESKKIRRLSVGANSNGILMPPPSKFANQVLQDEVSNRSESSAEQTDVKLNGDKDEIDVFAYASSSSSSDDEVTKLKYEIKKISHNNKVNGAGDAMISSRLNGSIKGKLRNNVKKKGVNGSDRNRKQKEDSAAVGSLKGECTDLVVASNNVSSSKRNSSNRRKRKMPGSGNVSKKVELKDAGTCDIDPDDDLEQNAARMLSSRFDPSCTGFASKSRTLTLSSVNGDCPPEKPTDNVGGENDTSADAAERVLRPRRHQKGKGDPRKTRHFYEIDAVDMDATWFLYKNIKIFWPIEESWYYGLVDKYDAEQKRYHIKFDDRDEEWISLENERFKVLLLPGEVPRTGKDDALEDNHTVDTNENKGEDMESEPIISWLARSSHRGKSSTSNSLKKQKLLHKSLDVCNSGNLGLLERETVSPHCGSSLLDASIDRLKNAMSVREKTNSSEGHPPIVYIRRRVRRYKKVARVTPWSLNDAGALKLDMTFIKSKTFEICISLWPVLTHVLGVDMLWLIHSVLLLRYGTVVMMWPSVFLEVLFVDNIVGLRLFLFKGCLKQAVAFVFLVMEVFCEPERDKSNNQQVPVTSIRFKFSFSQNFREQKIFSYYSFSKVRYSSWQHLDSEFQPHCSFTKQLSLPECTYDNIKLLEGGSQNLPLPSSGQTAFEGSRKKSNHGVVSMLGSSRLSIPGSRPSAIYSLKHGNLPPFALSFNAAPNFFLSLHLKLLLERSINSFSLHDHDSVHSFDPSDDTMHPHADDCSPPEISSESSSKSDESLSSLEAAGKDAALESVDGSQGNLTKLLFTIRDSLHSWADAKADYVGNGFGSGPKKPRTQVQYTLPSRDSSFKSKGHNQISLPYQRLRKANDKKTSDASKAADHNEWKLAVKCSGELKYIYKVHQDLPPGSSNRYTHAMIWKGGKDWSLEFPAQGSVVSFQGDARGMMPLSVGHWYLSQAKIDVERAMDASHVLYDMDNEDEEWVSGYKASCEMQGSKDDVISDELFEKVMDMLEKVSYAQKRDHFTPGEIEELIARGIAKVLKSQACIISAFIVSLHLKLLLERSINSFSLHDHDSVHSFDPSDDTMHPHADDCSPPEISSESSSKSDESLSSLEAAGKDAALESVDGSQGNLTKLVFDGDFNVNRTSISSKAAQTVPVNIENSDKCTGPSNLNGISVEIPTSEEIYRDSRRTPGSRQVSDLTWNLNDGIISSPNPTAPRSVWHRHKSGPSSSPFGDSSSSPFRDSLHSWADAKADYVGNGFGSGPKKPRTQVQYTLPSRDSSFKSKGHNQISLPYQRLRKANDKKTSDASKGPRRNLELVACAANLLKNSGDKGWRECGVRVFLEAADHNEWKLAVKCSGELKYIYKVHQDLPPGSSNRYTHAMIWKGGKDWSLEFPDRGQWILFKEMHEECHNRNIRASSIKNIPIPGVRLIEDLIDDQEVMPFVRGPWYFSQAKSDVERAMDASHVLYDMDNEDEEWVSGYKASCEMQGSKDDVISDELFEKVMDMLEKVSYAQKRDHFTPGEIEELIARVSPMQVGKSIYEYWREKRQRKGMPLIRQLQLSHHRAQSGSLDGELVINVKEPKGTEIPGLRMLATIPIYQDRQEISPPLWEKYQEICRQWDQSKPKLTAGPNTGSQEKASANDRPPMFAFCLRPRGLEVVNKGSKHRPHKKMSLSGHSHAFLGDHDTHYSSGRRVNAIALGDERADSSDVSPLLSRMYSPRDGFGPGPFSLEGNTSDWNHQHRFQRNNSKIIRTAVSPRLAMPSSSFRKPGKRNNGKKLNNTYSDWHNQPSSPYRHPGQLMLGASDLDEFRLRDASSAAKHARNMAKLKRERAQKLMLNADLAIHKAVSALMTAEAIKACTEGSPSHDSPQSTS
ncbi:enhancer of polycomb-like protein [Tanacetum coccineum]|uniref:Enhancer of polycomb-like protein n=1 Tax=Tanacetum coccineum TaxID=301880 RepID=A0ABQ5E6Z4_9ASTR